MIEWYYLVIISAILSVMVSIIQKGALRVEHATQYSSASSLLVAISSLIFIPFASLNMTALQLGLTILFGVLSSITLLLGTKVMRHGNISSITPLSNVLPILFTIVFAYIFLAEQLTLLQGFSVIGIMVVTYFLLFRKRRTQQLRRDFDNNKYKTMLVAGAFIGSVGGIIAKYLLVSMNVFSFLIINQIVVALCLAIFSTVKYDGVRGIEWTIKRYRWTFIAIVLLIVALRVIGYFALTVAPVNLASTLSNAVFVMLTVPIGGVLFKEGELRRKVFLSGAIMLFAYLLIAQ